VRGRKAFDPGSGASAGLSEVAQWPRLDRPQPRLQAAWHDTAVCGTRSHHWKDHRNTFKTPSPRRVSRLHEQCHHGFSERKLHVILDNLNTHKENEHWLKAHPNVQFHFTPTSGSWLNQVEVWFSILQGQSLSGASFTSLKQLQEHIDAYIKAYNDKAEPFVWTKKKVRQRRFKGRRITQL
jgi:DDE superfamily endonuclease